MLQQYRQFVKIIHTGGFGGSYEVFVSGSVGFLI